MINNVTISRAEYDRLVKLQATVDLIGDVEDKLDKDDILILLGIKEANEDA